MRVLTIAAVWILASSCGAVGRAAPKCESTDVAELCAIAKETLADNPAFASPGEWTHAAEEARALRRLKRRDRARAILNEITDPTWRDLFNAGYVILYGETPEERMLALAVAIRALSLAPNEPDARHLVAMTTEQIGRSYVGAQLYGRQKFFKLNPTTSAVEWKCLPQMIEPALPASVGAAFEAPPKGFDRCPKGVGEIAQERPIGGNSGDAER